MPAWSGLYDYRHSTPYALTNSRNAIQTQIAKVFEKYGMQAQSALAIALNGASAGGTATRTRTRVEAIPDVGAFVLGGKRNIVTETIINRVTTTADKDALNTLYNGVFAPTSYPVDKSGNGGGGKVGTL
jgi:hypothetical protein